MIFKLTAQDRKAAYRIIGRLQLDNIKLFQTLQSATAWIRATGGDCQNLDKIIAEQMPGHRACLEAQRAIANAVNPARQPPTEVSGNLVEPL